MNDKSCRGFTLIEMAIVVMIIGVLIASLSPLYARYQENQRVQATQANINTAISAIGSFRSLYGRYPCAAPLTATRNNPAYGREDCNVTDVAVNLCENGFCIEPSIRTLTTPFQYRGVTQTTPRIIVGTIPFRQLNIDEDGGYDGYKNRLMYVVTEHLTGATSFEPEQGGIEVLSDSGTSALDIPGSAHFMVFSYGPDALGGYNNNGIPLGCPGNSTESENCDFQSGSFDGTYRIGLANTSGNAGNYDDIVDYFTQDEMPQWRMSTDPDAGAHDIHQKSEEGDVAILMPAQDITQHGEVGGTVRAATETPPNPDVPTGRVIASELCTSGDVGCFSPLVIAGKIAEGNGMRCPPDQFMVAIKDGAPVCSDTVRDTCDTGEFATGISASGEIECSQTSGCPATPVQLCNLSANLPVGVEGDTQTVTRGNSARATYRCTDRQWVLQGAVTGSCACTPQDRTSTVGCPAGYSGTREQRVVRVCPSGTTTTTYPTSNCTCIDNYRQTRTRSCPSGFSGSIPQERFLRCGASPTTWEDVDQPVATAIARNCRCTDRTETRYRACGENETGSIEETRTIRCTDDGVQVGEWTPVGGRDDCRPKVCNWRTSSSPQGPYNFTVGKSLGSTCTCGKSGKCHASAGGNLYNHFQVCRCE